MNSFPFQGGRGASAHSSARSPVYVLGDRLHVCDFSLGGSGVRGMPVGRGRGVSSAGTASRASSVTLLRREACPNLRGVAWRVADCAKFFRGRVPGGTPCGGLESAFFSFLVITTFFRRGARVAVPPFHLCAMPLAARFSEPRGRGRVILAHAMEGYAVHNVPDRFHEARPASGGQARGAAGQVCKRPLAAAWIVLAAVAMAPVAPASAQDAGAPPATPRSPSALEPPPGGGYLQKDKKVPPSEKLQDWPQLKRDQVSPIPKAPCPTNTGCKVVPLSHEGATKRLKHAPPSGDASQDRQGGVEMPRD